MSERNGVQKHKIKHRRNKNRIRSGTVSVIEWERVGLCEDGDMLGKCRGGYKWSYEV